jgi:hypothetical protein
MGRAAFTTAVFRISLPFIGKRHLSKGALLSLKAHREEKRHLVAHTVVGRTTKHHVIVFKAGGIGSGG